MQDILSPYNQYSINLSINKKGSQKFQFQRKYPLWHYEIELIEKEMPDEINKSGRYNVHLISPKLDEIVHNSKILDAVEKIIGRDILVCSSTLFIKDPDQKGFVSYHQDSSGLKRTLGKCVYLLVPWVRIPLSPPII